MPPVVPPPLSTYSVTVIWTVPEAKVPFDLIKSKYAVYVPGCLKTITEVLPSTVKPSGQSVNEENIVLLLRSSMTLMLSEVPLLTLTALQCKTDSPA